MKQGKTALLFSAVKNATPFVFKENLAEMTELAVAANLHPIEKMSQNLKSIDPAYLIGVGKRKELESVVRSLSVDYIIFDHHLSGVQARNLQKELKVEVLDRTQLILEIFGQRAQSHEGKLQVELAQLMDQMPRMVGAWLGSLSRQGGSRGPGEKALETDRRQARLRIKRVKEKLKKVRRSRTQHRSVRLRNKTTSFALIGYTNSGKSTLLNVLTKSSVATKNQAFMTLDPKTRKVFIPGVDNAVMTDTVGFIRDLPPHLISAFKATLEESATASVILHIVDASSPHRSKNIKVVDDLIEEFGWSKKPILYVFNKTDLISETEVIPPSHCQHRISISARTHYNIDKLLLKMKDILQDLNESVELYFPKDKEYEIYKLSRETQITKRETGSQGTVCYVEMPSHQLSQWKKYKISGNNP